MREELIESRGFGRTRGFGRPTRGRHYVVSGSTQEESVESEANAGEVGTSDDWLASNLYERELRAIWAGAAQQETLGWLLDAHRSLDEIASGRERDCARTILERASITLTMSPQIEQSPEGGVIISFRGKKNNLTFLIEGDIGLIVATADAFVIKADFDLDRSSGLEFLERAVIELQGFAGRE